MQKNVTQMIGYAMLLLLPAGVYFYKLENNGQRAVGKVLLIK
jgi:hypothetical protein